MSTRKGKDLGMKTNNHTIESYEMVSDGYLGDVYRALKSSSEKTKSVDVSNINTDINNIT